MTGTEMEEAIGYIFVATFYKEYVSSSIGSIAVYVCDIEHDLPEDDGCDNFLFNAMGFKNEIEYINSYPGRLIGNSSLCKMIHNRSIQIQKNKTYINIDRSVVGFKEDIDSIISYLDSGCELFVIPTRKQIKDGGGEYLKKQRQKDLWFCSDWREPKET